MKWVKKPEKKQQPTKKSAVHKVSAIITNNKLWKKLRLGQKYGVALFIVIGLFAVSTIITFILLSMASAKMNMVEKAGENSINLAEATAIFHRKGSVVSNYIIDSNPKHLNAFTELTDEFNNVRNKIEPQLADEYTKSTFGKIAENDAEISRKFQEEIVDAVKLMNVREYRLRKLQTDTLIGETIVLLDDLNGFLHDEQAKAMQAAKGELVLTLAVLGISIIISGLLGVASIVIIGRIISRNLNEIVHVSNEISAGNLNVQDISVNGEDEIALLGKTTNAMKDQLQSVIKEITSVSQYVTDRSGELQISATEVKAATQQVASTMQELSGGAEEQANSATTLAKMMEDYMQTMETVTENGSTIQASSNAVLEMTRSGDELMKKSQEQMGFINKIMKESVEKVNGLDDQSKQISKLVGVIQEIADQTNLLALNAAIEAARAGEHGRGFAVVADEVRKLAEQVAFSVKDITGIVQNIQSESTNVVSSLKNGYEEVEAGTNQILLTGETFQKITIAVESMTGNVNDISDSLRQVSESTDTMNRFIENIASVSEQSAAGIEQTSASMEQTNHSMEEISENVQSLSEFAGQLNGMITKFKVN